MQTLTAETNLLMLGAAFDCCSPAHAIQHDTANHSNTAVQNLTQCFFLGTQHTCGARSKEGIIL